MPLPRRGSRRDDDRTNRPPAWAGPQPLAAVATAVTLIVIVAALRTWYVHRPPVEVRTLDARTRLAEFSEELVDVVQDLGPSAPLEDVAELVGRIPMSERTWREEIVPAARLRDRADTDLALLLEAVPEAVRPKMRRRLAYGSLDAADRADLGDLDAAAWNEILSNVLSIENERVREADETLERISGLPALRSSAVRGQSLAAASGLAGDALLTGEDLARVRDHLEAVAAGSEHRRRIGLRMLALALAAATAWYAVRRDRRDRQRSGSAGAGPRLTLSVARRDGHSEGGAALAIMLVGGILLASRLILEPAVPGSITWGILEIILLHVAAGICVPWKDLRESIVPFVPLLVAWVIAFMLPAGDSAAGGVLELGLFDRVVVAMLSPLALVPGAVAAEWRLRVRLDRETQEELRGRVSFVDDELSRARIVHDAMFPPSFADDVVFDYTYEPIHEIGGDYVHVHRCDASGRVTVTLLDVAGHGLAAALTVNRLFGELERILAEDASARPQEIMGLLNRYIHLTMARHSLFATGTCMTLDPRSGELCWVSAGHPPSILRRADGAVSELETTTMLLGALGPDEFESIEECVTLGPGDLVIAYTDGAFEARNAAGQQYGLERIRDLVSFDTPPRSWSRFIAGAVQAHHGGAADDDILIATLMLRGLRIGRTA